MIEKTICTRVCAEKLGETAHQSSEDVQSSASSVQSLFQFLHGKCPHGLRRGLGLEDTRFLGEWVDALLGWGGGLLLQLQVQHSCQFEISVLFDFTGGHSKESVNDTLHLLVLQTVGLCHGCDNLRLCECSRLHGRFCFHGFHCGCHSAEKKIRQKTN